MNAHGTAGFGPSDLETDRPGGVRDREPPPVPITVADGEQGAVGRAAVAPQRARPVPAEPDLHGPCPSNPGSGSPSRHPRSSRTAGSSGQRPAVNWSPSAAWPGAAAGWNRRASDSWLAAIRPAGTARSHSKRQKRTAQDRGARRRGERSKTHRTRPEPPHPHGPADQTALPGRRRPRGSIGETCNYPHRCRGQLVCPCRGSTAAPEAYPAASSIRVKSRPPSTSLRA